MKLNHFGVLAAGLLCASALFATPIGIMSLASDTSGGVNVQGTRIDFFPTTNLPPAAPGTGVFNVGNPTGISYSLGTVTSLTDANGTISDLDSSPPFPVGGLNFISFASAPTLHFDITGLGPGGPAQGAINGCASPGFLTCSPSIGGGLFSPFLLRFNGTGTNVDLSVTLLAHDGTGSMIWNGDFTTQIVGQTPAQLESTLLAGGLITNTWSFTAASLVPEPGTFSVFGSGLMLIGFAAWRRRK